jgi:hypothetical protein
MKKNMFIAAVALAAGVLFLSACERETDPETPNQPPNTSVANVPNDSSLQRAVLTFYWDGEDSDGFVQYYQYRVVSYLEPMGIVDTTEWKDTISTTVTIPVRSDDEENFQVFQVRAVDDKGAVDPTPAEKPLFTYTTSFPSTQILYPGQGEKMLIAETITDWWPGIPLSFDGVDTDGDILQYGWAVDGGDTTWTTDTAVVIDPSLFDEPLDGQHTILVTCMDDTYLMDTVGKKITVDLVFPSFEKKAIILDATDESKWNTAYSVVPTDDEVDGFYQLMFPEADQYDLKENLNHFPEIATLGQYQCLIWHSDHYPSSDPQRSPIHNYVNQLRNYMNVGGYFILGGHLILKSFNWSDAGPWEFSDSSFVAEYLHIFAADETSSLWLDFRRGIPNPTNEELPYTEFYIDEAKVKGTYVRPPGVSTYGLNSVQLITAPGGFTEQIFQYDNDPASNQFGPRMRTVALRYYGTEFQSIILGFPMWFVDTTDAIELGDEMFRHLGLNE